MTISSDLEAKILRYYHVEKWRVGTIANQLNVHGGTVQRVLAQAGLSKTVIKPQKSIIDSFLPFILEQLDKYPKLTASRLYDMVCERGYAGGSNHFRHLIALYRKKPAAEAYLRLRTLPAEQAQVDWGHFGHITVGKAKRALSAFVMVLSFSRKVFLRFYLNQRMENFLRGHQEAFEQWGGVPRVLLFDNLKSAVLERQGNAIRFNPTLLDFAAHYRFEPRPVAVARGNEKGRVERAIRYIREGFFAGRQWNDLDDLNAQAQAWCDGQASNRPCPEDKSQTVNEVFLKEQPKLISLPDNPYSTDEKETVKVGKTPYIRFDLNDYSIPHTYTKKSLTVIATLKKVCILDGLEKIAEHVRSFDKNRQVENPAHIEELIKRKRQASQHRGQDRLTQTISCGRAFLERAADAGYQLKSTVSHLLQLLDDYGAAAFEIAMDEALMQQVFHPNRVQLNLEKNRTSEEPPIPLSLPNDKRLRDIVVKPHQLESYDQLQPASSHNGEHSNEQ